MIDVHLIGYTADLEHLVLDLDGEANGRYRLVVDADLLATLREMHERTVEEGRDWPGDELVEGDDGWDGEDTEDWDHEDDEDDDRVDAADLADAEEEAQDDDGEGDDGPEAEVVPSPEPAPAPPRPDPAPRPGTEPVATPLEEPSPQPSPPVAAAGPAPGPSEPDRREAKLSPAEIQGLLRAGRSAKSVARAAGTDVSWIERWLAPILEERARMLREAHAGKLERPRLGTSRAALGEAVQRSLAERKVDPDDISWETSRRADGRWKVSVKYRHRNRSRTASWAYDPRDGALEPSSDLARELGFRAPRAKRSQPKPKPKPKPKPQSKASPKRQ